MKQHTRHIETELAIIGSGLAGVAASIFALNRAISTAQAGNTGAIAYTTGYLDLLGHLPSAGAGLDDPWEGISRLRQIEPHHPLAQISETDIRAAFAEFTDFLAECGMVYTRPAQTNLTALTPAGTLKKTLCVPATMQAGVKAFSEKAPCLLFDFKGLRGFSARQIVANLQSTWPQLRCARIAFPDVEPGELYPEVLARALEVPQTRARLAESIRAEMGSAQYIGMPAILGIHLPDLVMAELQEQVGVPLFEIPTMPPSVPGIRLRELFEQHLPHKGLILIPQQKVLSAELGPETISLALKDNYGPIRITSRTAILATGRFISGGLEARRSGIVESLLGIPVSQPPSRQQWYRPTYMDPLGHDIHRAGIEVDEQFRPLDGQGRPLHPRLFAAGILLAHQDWIRSRCGAGVALASAFRAVNAINDILQAERLTADHKA